MDQYNNTYHHSIIKKPINADDSPFNENIETNSKAPKLKVNDRVRITKYKDIFSKGHTENWSREIFIINPVLKLTVGHIKQVQCNNRPPVLRLTSQTSQK